MMAPSNQSERLSAIEGSVTQLRIDIVKAVGDASKETAMLTQEVRQHHQYQRTLCDAHGRRISNLESTVSGDPEKDGDTGLKGQVAYLKGTEEKRQKRSWALLIVLVGAVLTWIATKVGIK